MSRIIAIWGCPNSGKTTFALNLTKAIHDGYGAKVICVFADSTTPTLPVLFPNHKAGDIRSLGTVLSHTDITQDAILKNLVTTDAVKNIGFLGYTDGENRWTYPEYSQDKAAAFFDAAMSLADYIIVDCGNKLTGTLAFAAISKADSIFRICKPDLKAISFFSSQIPLYGDLKYRMEEHQPVLNVPEQGSCLPVEEAAQHFGCEKLILPFAPEIRQQAMNGQLFGKVTHKGYRKTMDILLRKAAGQ